MRIEGAGASWTGLLIAVLCSTGCRKESHTDGYFHAAGQLATEVCACDVDSEVERAICTPAIDLDCQRGVVRKHEESLGDFLDCAADHVREQTRCVRAAGCDGKKVAVCLSNGVDDVCGEVPEDLSDTLRDEFASSCPHVLFCDDGTHALGGECDGNFDCPDASDELAENCAGPSSGGDSDQAGGTAQVAPAAPLPMAGAPLVPPPPSSMSGRAGAPGTVDVRECVDLALLFASELIDPTCAQCACITAPQKTLGCDANCWQLIGCAAEFCAAPDGGMDNQLACVQQNCKDSVISAGPSALSLVSAIRGDCASRCPTLEL